MTTARAGTVVSFIVLALVVGTAPAIARAQHGGLEVAMLMAPLPAIGVEVQSRPHVIRSERVLLSWPLQFTLDRDRTFRDNPIHRLVLSPELRLIGDAEFGGRVGYRWNTPFFFAGIGASYSDSLSVCGSPEVGARYFTKDDVTKLFVVARADLSVAHQAARRWAASVSVGLSVF